VTVLPSHCEWAHNSDLGSSSLSSCLDRGGLFDSSFEGVFEKREGVGTVEGGLCPGLAPFPKEEGFPGD